MTIRAPSKTPTTKLNNRPISKLPDDVLCKIFHLLRLDPPVFKPHTFFSFWEYQKKALDWVAISWVCQRWRAVALNDPTLWAEPPLHFPRWTIEMLRRSKNKGLSVNLGRTPNNEILSVLFGQPLRIAQLTISDENLKMLLPHFTLSSAPILEKLCIKKSSYGRTEETTLNYQLPGTIFVDAISLRHLELAGVDIDWNSHLLSSSLQALDLGQISSTARPTMAIFRTILSRMSALQTLKLHQALPVEHGMSLAQGAVPIALASLQHLSIGHKPLEVTSFFNNFALSGHTRNVNVVVSLENGPSQDLDCLLASVRRREALGRFVLNAQSVAINGQIDGTTSRGQWQKFNLEMNATEVLASSLTAETSEDDLPGLDLKIRSKLPTSASTLTSTTAKPFRCVFTDIFNAFEWLNVRELTLVDLDIKSYPEFGRVLATTLGTLPTIYTIAIGPKCVDHLLGALNHGLASAQSSTSIAFLGLAEIMIVDVPLQSRLTLIIETLLNRQRRGVPIQKLGFEDCRGKNNKYIQLLREIIREVEWDGVKL
jgi:hypothetical protein